MRIMIATETYAPAVNGAAVFTQRLAAGLAGRGHTVGVVAPSPTGRPYPEWHGGRLTIYRTRSAPTPYPRQRCALLTLRGAEAILTPFRPDVVHIQNHFVLGRTLARAARVRHIPTLGTNHFMAENMLPHVPRILRAGPMDRLLHHELWRQFVALYGQLDCVTVPSHAAADLVRTQGLSGRMHVISNGIDVARFHPALDVYGAARDGLLILYVGRLDPEKGVDTLIRAMPSVLRSHAATLVLSGRGVHEPTLRGLVEALDLSARVRFTGFVPDDELPAQYQAATLFVMPSRHELQSLATLEAMATGLPIVAADRMALPELVEDGTNGFLFPSGDPVTLADRIVRLLSDPAQAARMGQASRRVAERHGLERTLAAFEALYEEVRLTGRASGPVKPATRCWFRPWG